MDYEVYNMRFNATRYLESLFDEADSVAFSAMAETREADVLPADWHLQWDERAACLEDEGLHRERAEAQSLTAVLREMRASAAKGPDATGPKAV